MIGTVKTENWINSSDSVFQFMAWRNEMKEASDLSYPKVLPVSYITQLLLAYQVFLSHVNLNNLEPWASNI